MDIPKIEELNPANCRSCSFQNKWPEFYRYLQDKYPTGTFSEKLALYYHHLDSIPTCVVCGGPVKFVNFRTGWRATCSAKCQGKNPDVRNKVKQTCLERYGAENPGKIKAFQHKAKRTNLERYGVENSGWTPEAQQRIKATNLERYGVEHPMQSEIIKKKSEQTCIERYGVPHNTSNLDIKKKVAQTNLERYGGTGFASIELTKKGLETCAKRFGAGTIENVSQIPEVRSKMSKSLRQNSLDNHDNIIGYTEDFRWICKCPHPNCTACQERTYITDSSTQGNRIRVGAEICTNLLPQHSQHSSLELWVKDIITCFGLQYELGNRTVLNGQEIDIYIPELKVGFECNGYYWHSSKFKTNKYHQEKSILAESTGIKLYHIWEDWIDCKPDIIRSMILNWIGRTPNKIYARQCDIRPVPGHAGMKFFEDNHIQGRSKYEIAYGLYYNDELVSIMSFGHKRGCVGKATDKGRPDEWELIRFCSKTYTSVVGGASKLLKHFIKQHTPRTIYSYASKDISTGSLYETLGFHSDGHITPSYWYIDPKTNKRYHRTSFTKDRIVKLGWKPDKVGWTEKKVMEEHGYYRIYDAGQTKWTLTL